MIQGSTVTLMYAITIEHRPLKQRVGHRDGTCTLVVDYLRA